MSQNIGTLHKVLPDTNFVAFSILQNRWNKICIYLFFILVLLFIYFFKFIYLFLNLFIYLIYLLLWRCDPMRVMSSLFLMFLDHTQRRITVGRTPLDE